MKLKFNTGALFIYCSYRLFVYNWADNKTYDNLWYAYNQIDTTADEACMYFNFTDYPIEPINIIKVH